MAKGIGAFFEGYTEGAQWREKQALLQKEQERADRQMALAEAADKRQGEAHGLSMKTGQQAYDSGAIDLENKKRDQEYQKDLAARMQDLIAQSQGGIEGDVIDKNGQSQGVRRFQNIEAANQALGSQGFAFRPGSVKEAGPMDPIDFQLKFADLTKEVAAKHGKLDLKMMKESRDYGRQLRQEGAIDALKYYLTTQDEKGAKEMFNKKGGIKIGDDIKLGVEQGEMGPVVVGYKVGPKGQKEKVFDGFQDVILPSMSPEAYSQTVASFRMQGLKEKGENFRTGVNSETQLQVARMRESGENARAGAGSGKEDKKALYDIHKTRFSGIFRNPQDVLEANRQKAIEAAVLHQAEDLVSAGVGVGKAYDLAQQQVFKDFKVQTEELNKK